MILATAATAATAATLHAHGQTQIETTSQAAEALKPIAGSAALVLFGLAIGVSGVNPMKALVYAAVMP